MSKKLDVEFFGRPTLLVARDLLGKFIFRKFDDGKTVFGMIAETEAYMGPMDKAAHTYGGKMTQRTNVLYEKKGLVYIYMVYGMHYQLNFSTGSVGAPEGVLIRAVILEGGESKLTNGPGKLCRYFQLDKSFYGENVAVSNRIWVEDRNINLLEKDIKKGKRIGIDYAGKYWAARRWRFWIERIK